MRHSISALKTFKACRRAYQFRYIEELVPNQTTEALETGHNYHDLLEQLYTKGDFLQEFTKECAMATAYKKYIYPKFSCHRAEEWQHFKLSDEYELFGRVDGIADDGALVEHKTTNSDITEGYEYDLQWDEQLLAYMLMSGARKMWYTVCKKPTIRLKKGESEQEFFERMVAWYDEDTDSKIRLIEVFRTDEEVEAFRQDILELFKEVDGCRNFYRNCLHCNKWGRRCEYSSICLNYDPTQEYIEFHKKEEMEYGVK